MLPALGPGRVGRQKGRSVAQRHGKDYNSLHTKQKIKKGMVVISAACSFLRCAESLSLGPGGEATSTGSSAVGTEPKPMRQN